MPPCIYDNRCFNTSRLEHLARAAQGGSGARVQGKRKDGSLFSLRIVITESLMVRILAAGHMPM